MDAKWRIGAEMTITVSGPDGSSIDFPDGTDSGTIHGVMTQHFGGGAQPAAAPPAPVTANALARSAATGVPVIGGLLNKADAATNALLAPVVEPFMTKSADSINDAPGETIPQRFRARYQKSLDIQNKGDAGFAAAHPYIDTAAELAGGAASLGGVAAAVPGAASALGMTGRLVPAALKGAASGAAIGGADAVVRGTDPTSSAEVGALTGAGGVVAGKVLGNVWDAVSKSWKTAPPVPTRTMDVNGLPVPIRESVATGDPLASQMEQKALHGGMGDEAQKIAAAHAESTDAALAQAHGNLAASLDQTGTTPRTTPQAAGETVATELASAEQQRAAAEAARQASVAGEGAAIRTDLNPGAPPVDTPHAAAGNLSDSIAAARDAAKADYRGKYGAAGQAPGDFEPGSAAGFRNDVEAGLNSSDNPVSLDPTNTPKSLQALKVIDERLNAAGPGPKVAATPAEGVPFDPTHAQNVKDIRERFGDDVAAAYDRQKTTIPPTPPTAVAADAPKAQSLLEFLASKGGLGPDSELAAIGGHSHTVNVEGIGRRKLVRQGGMPLDYAREAAQEAGYLRGDHNGTSTPNQFLDAIDAEIRGKKLYPEGFEGTVSKREAAAMSEHEQHDYANHIAGLEDDLAAAGHSDIAPDVKARAVSLMDKEGMHPDTAVDHAIMQLDQEDAAGITKAGGASSFPGDSKPSQAPPRGSSFTMRDVEQVRKQLSTLYGDARRAMMSGGSGADVHALGQITDHFDARVSQMIKDGKFSGDGPAVLKMVEDARASFADYKKKFTKRGSGDTVGAAVEKILGKFSDTKATPDNVLTMAYGSSSTPGGQMPVQIAQRIIKIFGKASPEFATYRQGLLSHMLDTPDGISPLSNEVMADRIHNFFSGSKGAGLAQQLYSPVERSRMLAHANSLRTAIDPAPAKGVDALIAKWSGRGDGGERASAKTVVDTLMGESGKNGLSPLIVRKLRDRISPQGMTAIKQGVWSRITEDADGAINWGDQKIGQRIAKFLNGDGKGLADELFSPAERKAMMNIAEAHLKNIPVPGTTNPSGSGHLMARMAHGARHSLLPIVGFSHGGLPGAALGTALDKAVTMVGNKRSAAKALNLFYGPQVSQRTAVVAPQRFGALAGHASANQSSR